MHPYAYAERLVEHSQDGYDHRHEHGHSTEHQEQTTLAGGVMDGEKEEDEKGANVDHHPQGGGDLRCGQEQQSLPGLVGVSYERVGAPIG